MSIPKIREESLNSPLKSPVKRIGVFGGTFDPIHFGHIHTAKQTAQWLNLDRLLILPSHIPPHKSKTSATAIQRLAMVDLVCQKEPSLVRDKRELNKHSPSYTVETLQEIKGEYAQAQLFFIVGMDSLLTFKTWYKYQDILSLSHLVVNTRPNYHLDEDNIELSLLLAKHQINHPNELKRNSAGCILFHDSKDWNISSTQIRDKIKNNQNCSEFLPADILSYINEEQLYR